MTAPSPPSSPRSALRGPRIPDLAVPGLAALPLALLWLWPPAPNPGQSAGTLAAGASASGELARPSPPPATAGTSSALGARGASGCAGQRCAGAAGPELRAALQAKAGQARSCYRTVLRDRPGLRGAMALSVRVGSGGQVCSATVTGDELREAAVTACVTNLFRASRFPAPDGGCVDVSVPMNFVPKP